MDSQENGGDKKTARELYTKQTKKQITKHTKHHKAKNMKKETEDRRAKFWRKNTNKTKEIQTRQIPISSFFLWQDIALSEKCQKTQLW